MQRSLSYQNPLTPYFYGVLFLLYTALSGIHLFLPPLFAILYFYFSKALKNEDSIALFLLIFCLILFEAANGYVLFSAIIYFFLLHRYIVPKIMQSFSCAACIRFIVALLVYLGFFLFYSLLSSVFMFPSPHINSYVFYYIAIEFLILSVL
ncbi:MAG: hypothetical protein OEL19_02300 [Sulfurimonas sp.]|nr:hypothetical protein [Sulfurimonas sp.]